MITEYLRYVTAGFVTVPRVRAAFALAALSDILCHENFYINFNPSCYVSSISCSYDVNPCAEEAPYPCSRFAYGKARVYPKVIYFQAWESKPRDQQTNR